MTTKTAAEQVAEALRELVRHFEFHRLHETRLSWIVHREARAALDRWRAEQDSAPKATSKGGEA